MDRPERFAAPLPASEAELEVGEAPMWTPRPTLRVSEPERYPPYWTIQHGLVHGDAAMQARVVDALARAQEAGALTARLVDWYVALVEPALSPASCGWLAGLVGDPARRAAHGMAWRILPDCREVVGELMARADSPDEAVFAWALKSGHYGSTPWSERVERALTHVALTTTDERRVWHAGWILARVSGDAGVEAAKRLADRLDDPDRRAVLLARMLLHDTAAGHAIGVGACALGRPATARDCASASEPWEPPKPRDASAYERCVLNGLAQRLDVLGHWPDCLAHLAALDRALAVRIATAILNKLKPGRPWVVTGYDQDVAVALARFPVAGDLALLLDALGLTDRGGDRGFADRGRGPPVTAAELLEARGRLTWLTCEALAHPFGHDEFAYALARLVRPTLDDVLFAHDDAAGATGPPGPPGPTSRLHAWMDGRRYSVATGDEVSASLLGLLNALLVVRGSEERLVWVEECGVVAAPVAALGTLAEHGLLIVSRYAR